ncbi:MAG: hypothetical protein JNM09_22615 [Blastocatellia bacterium]|nr:hypothetical protein [Blastocatellia bacterium]
MNNQTSKTVAMILTTVGVLFMISTAFSLLPWNIAVFAGIACFIVAGLVRRMGKQHE